MNMRVILLFDPPHALIRAFMIVPIYVSEIILKIMGKCSGTIKYRNIYP